MARSGCRWSARSLKRAFPAPRCARGTAPGRSLPGWSTARTARSGWCLWTWSRPGPRPPRGCARPPSGAFPTGPAGDPAPPRRPARARPGAPPRGRTRLGSYGGLLSERSGPAGLAYAPQEKQPEQCPGARDYRRPRPASDTSGGDQAGTSTEASCAPAYTVPNALPSMCAGTRCCTMVSVPAYEVGGIARACAIGLPRAGQRRPMVRCPSRRYPAAPTTIAANEPERHA